MGNVRYKGDNYTRSSLSSGSNVVPNPEGEATETLSKIGIDNTIYDFPKELPEVTSADEGDVLAVNANGEWTKSVPSGGGVLNIINATCSSFNRSASSRIQFSDTVRNIVMSLNNADLFARTVILVKLTSDLNKRIIRFAPLEYVPVNASQNVGELIFGFICDPNSDIPPFYYHKIRLSYGNGNYYADTLAYSS